MLFYFVKLNSGTSNRLPKTNLKFQNYRKFRNILRIDVIKIRPGNYKVNSSSRKSRRSQKRA